MKFRVVFILSSFSLVLVSCMQKQLLKAEEAYIGQQYCDGASKMISIYPKLKAKGDKAKRTKGDMAYQIAESFRLSMNFTDATEWYKRAIDLDYAAVKPEVYLYNGQVLQQMGKIADAQKNFEEYKKIAPNDSRGDVGLQSCKSFEENKDNKTKYIVENQAMLNSKEFDMAPVFGDKKNTKMYYSSTRTGGTPGEQDNRICGSFMDLWVSTVDVKGNYGEPKLVVGEGINTEDNEGTVCFDGKGKFMFFTRCPNEKKQNLGCDIWMAELKGKEEFANATKLELKTSDTVSVGHPCVSDDGKFLIFASDMPGGFGGRDLWYTTFDKKANKWAAPINMGKEINTAGNEMFPTFSIKGDLYYATDGMIGLGGLDIVKAKKVGEENKWENPKNMGYPINSESDDYALIELRDEKTIEGDIKGFFTSDRKGPNGTKPDIYSYTLPPNLFTLTVNLNQRGEKSKKLSKVPVTIKGSDGSKIDGITSSEGKFTWDKNVKGDRLIKENVDYTIELGSLEGYYDNKNISKITTKGLTDNQDFVVELEMMKIVKEIRLPEIRYAYNDFHLLTDSTINSKDSLNFVYDLLTEFPGLVLKLMSNTDSRGKDAYNHDLSQKRAQECVRYLVEEKGVDARRLIPVGNGETVPQEWIDEKGAKIILTEAYINQFKKDTKKFEMLHQLNRRTSAEVVKTDFDPNTAPPLAPAEGTTPPPAGK